MYRLAQTIIPMFIPTDSGSSGPWWVPQPWKWILGVPIDVMLLGFAGVAFACAWWAWTEVRRDWLNDPAWALMNVCMGAVMLVFSLLLVGLAVAWWFSPTHPPS